MRHRFAGLAAFAVVAVWSATDACSADGIEPGLWNIAVRSISNGAAGPPQQSNRCLTAEQAKDVATTFSPVSKTVNSTCAPLERQFADQKLTWRLVCKGQLDMEITGEFHFDGPKHYTATTTTKAMMAGQTMIDSRDLLDANWVSECASQ
jgi:hypothetical protein